MSGRKNFVKNVKILVINPYDNIQSYEHRPMQEAQYFKKLGCEVETLVLERKIIGKGVEKNEIEGISVKHFLSKSPKMVSLMQKNKLFQKLCLLFYGKCFFDFIRWLGKEIGNNSDDFIIAHNLEMAFAACVVNKFRANKIVFVMRELYEGQSSNKIKGFVISKISHWVQNNSYALVQVVPAQQRETKGKNRKKIYYIPNYPESSNYAGVENTLSDEIRINYIGCVRDVKSIKMLMDAAKDIKGIKIGIHGIGEAYEYLKSIEENYENVEITGYYDYKTETNKLFSNSDIIYCAYNIDIPNWKIAYPIKLYEAIESGIPTLLCEGMEPAKLVKKYDCGFVFEYEVEKLRQMLLQIQEHRDILEEKKKNVLKLKGQYIWENVVSEYEKIIEG